MTIETLVAVFAILLTISLAAERLIEAGKPLFEKITSPSWQSSAKLISAIVVGSGCAALFRFDLLGKLGIGGVSVLVGYLAAGLISSTGSTTINRCLEWLKTLKNNTVTQVVTESIPTAPNITKVTVVATTKSDTAPVETVSVTQAAPPAGVQEIPEIGI